MATDTITIRLFRGSRGSKAPKVKVIKSSTPRRKTRRRVTRRR